MHTGTRLYVILSRFSTQFWLSAYFADKYSKTAKRSLATSSHVELHSSRNRAKHVPLLLASRPSCRADIELER
jgi:hypothetical protein